MKRATLAAFTVLFSALNVFAIGGYINGTDASPTDLATFVRQIPKGSVVVLGEIHNLEVQQARQLELMQELRKQGHEVSVGLEFFERPNQVQVDQWLNGELSEKDFLEAIAWGGFSFDNYKLQAQFPDRAHGETTLALNVPRRVTTQIGRSGLASLSAQDRALLPADFTLGNRNYLMRFAQQMPHHVPIQVLENYFTAQSAWDDSMALTATDYMKAHPGKTLVIVVGAFHAEFGGGLPDRIHARWGGRIFNASYLDSSDMTDDDVKVWMLSDPKVGPRADLLWLDREL